MSPGAWKRSRDRFLYLSDVWSALPSRDVVVVADERVLKLHPRLARNLKGRPVIKVRAGEGAKSVRTLEKLTVAALAFPRKVTVVAIGGGTIGDLVTVFAHVFKRGVARLIHVPTTLLAAVDSSVGGKGALNVAGAKNVLGVFHAADECWLIPELFETLTEAQRREGRIEALKMVVTLDARKWASWREGLPDDAAVIRIARALKNDVVDRDPYETKGLRTVLNFGHTFGHVIESLSNYRVRHGEAVGLGMLYALDEGVRRGVTPKPLADAVEAVLPVKRAALAPWLAPKFRARVKRLLAADKKGAWVLLEAPGRVRIVPFEAR
ncbi:MAG: 3-dehydroquinate synthase family protein [Myxococcaceae bacterium]